MTNRYTFIPNRPYTLSGSKKVQLFDFYVLSYISTLNLDYSNKSFIGSFVCDTDSLIFDIKFTEDVLLSYLKEDLLLAVFESMSGEIRHSRSQICWDYENGFEYAFKNDFKNGKFPNIKKWFKGYFNRVRSRNSYQVRARDVFYHFYHKDLSGLEKIVNEYKKIFTEYVWDSDYGGEKWGSIADGFLRLIVAKSKSDLFIAIDHIYDLQHNNGCVLNKIQRFSTFDEGHDWIGKSLNFKRRSKCISKLFPKCSSDMKKLALKCIKASGVKLVSSIDLQLGRKRNSTLLDLITDTLYNSK